MPVTLYNLYSLTFYYSSIDIIRPPLKRDFYLVKNGNVIWWFDLFRLKLYKLFPLMILGTTLYKIIHDSVLWNALIWWDTTAVYSSPILYSIKSVSNWNYIYSIFLHCYMKVLIGFSYCFIGFVEMDTSLMIYVHKLKSVCIFLRFRVKIDITNLIRIQLKTKWSNTKSPINTHVFKIH